MKITELTEEDRFYILKLSNGDSFSISGRDKIQIMNSTSQFYGLANGEVINKSFIVSILTDREKTKEQFSKRLNP